MGTVAQLLDLAMQMHRTGNLDQAEKIYLQMLQADANNPDAHHLLGAIAYQRGCFDRAAQSIRLAVTLNPSDPVYHNNLGLTLAALGLLEEAAESYRQALRLQLRVAEVFTNLGIVLFRQGLLDEALTQYQEALRLQPDFAKAHNDLALLHLLRGDFKRGWSEYEWRWAQPGITRRPFAQPLWDGSDLAGRTILLYGEQGLGDTLQFVRYAPLVKQRGGVVYVECQPALVRLLDSVPGIDCVLAGGAVLPPFDVQAALLSLPRIFQADLDTIPKATPYLQADPERVEYWRRQLAPLPGLKVGIAWQGSPTFRYDRQRSIPLTHFGALAQVEGVKLISLQKGPGTDQLQTLGGQFPVLDLGRQLDESSGPFTDTAAIMMNVDLVISSDTVIPHLAGALGIPVWVALHKVPDWRWLMEREDSPWYPTMRLFRQTHSENWHDVFEKLAQELRCFGERKERPDL